ncbi:MAG: MarP family serine protease [Solirubrobacteraceae bacterium]
MTTIDWVIVAFAALLALRGYSRGFLVGALTLAGFAAGALIGTRLGPVVLSRGDRSPYAALFGLAGGLLVGGILATALEGVGRRLRAILPIPLLRTLDGLLGALLTGALALALAWLLGAIVLQASGSRTLRADIQRSVILRELNAVLPPSGPILNALARIDPLPSVSGPTALVPAPARGILASAGVRAAVPSVVRVVGTACGLGIEGSGWVAAHDLVVTNAHVVAGESDTVVEVGGEPPDLSAVPVVFDAHNDIAVLRVQGLDETPLALAPDPSTGTGAAILGYPLDGPFDAQPGRLGQTQLTATENAYGDGPVLRVISSLRGLVRPGNSGGPMIDRAGSVVGTVFAAITHPPAGDPGGFAVPNSVVGSEIARARASDRGVSSGTCTG